MRGAECRQYGPQHLLRRRLADASGDRDKAAGEALACVAAKAMQAGQGIMDEQQAADLWHRAMHHRAGRTLGDGVSNEGVTVARLALQGDKQVAGLDGARIDRNAGGGERRAHGSAGGLEQIMRGPSAGSWREHEAADDIHVVERDHGVADRLTLLMALPCHNEYIARRKAIQCCRNGLRAIADFASTVARREHGGADRGWILAARIVVGDDRHIGKACGRGAHQRTLAAVSVTAGAEYHVQPTRRVWTQRSQQPFQRIRRVCVVHIHGSAVWQTRRQLQPAAHTVQQGETIQDIGFTKCRG